MNKRAPVFGGFTLIELLVVISVIAMLSTIVIASTQSVQAQGRDAVRMQQVGQIDRAIQLYFHDYGSMPSLGGTCSPLSSGTPTSGQAAGCTAVSTAAAGSPQAQAWSRLASDLQPYMARLPADPCPGCASASGYTTGYTYVSPLAMQYLCVASGCSQSGASFADDYQLYAPLERGSAPAGQSTSGSFYSPTAPTPTIAITPTPIQITSTYVRWNVLWVTSNVTSCTGSDARSLATWTNPLSAGGAVQFQIPARLVPPQSGVGVPTYVTTGESDTVTIQCTSPAGPITQTRVVTNP